MKWRHVAAHTRFIHNELADRVALIASRGAVVSGVGPLPRPLTSDMTHMPRTITEEAVEFWTDVMMKPDPKFFEQKE